MQRTTPTLLALLLMAMAPLSAAGQSSTLSGFALLNLDPSARSAGIGSADAALRDDDPNAFFRNAALSNENTHRQLSATYLNHLGDIQAGSLSFGYTLDGIGHAGVGLRFITFGDIEGHDEHGLPTGTFGAGDVVLTTGLARSLTSQLHVGANIHLGYSRIEATSATALMGDLGAAYTIPEHRLVLSASVNHVGTALSRYYEASLPLPTDVRLGLAHRLEHLPVSLLVNGYDLHRIGQYEHDATTLKHSLQHLALGLEAYITEALDIRLGYSHRHQQALQQAAQFDLAGLSAGFGIHIDPIQFDYAYRSWSTAIGGLHQFTLRTQI